MLNLSDLKSPLLRAAIAITITMLLLSSTVLPPAQAAAGDLDTTFSGDGKVTTAFANVNSTAQAVAIQSDGKIVAAGSTFPDSALPIDIAVARYNSDGTLDLSFGTGGKVVTDFFGGQDNARAVAVQPDGKIVVAGSAETPADGFDFALVRYNADGSLDASFGSGGKVTDFFGPPGFAFNDVITDITLRPDGKIIVVGSTNGGLLNVGTNFALARYNADGSLDASFGSGGKVATDFFVSVEDANAVAVQQDGKIVAAGRVSVVLNQFDFALARYNADGSLDTSFSLDGKVDTNFNVFDAANSIAVQADGKILVAGNAKSFGGVLPPGGISDYALARYNANGSLDASFGSGGKVTFSNNLSHLTSMILQPDSKILVAGDSVEGFKLVQFNSDGSLDTGFGTGGKVTTDFFGFAGVSIKLTLQPDGKVVAAGGAFTSETHFDFGLARYNGTGQGASFDLCIQDDINGNLLQFNSTTGDYQFSNCRKQITLTGRGTVKIRFCKVEFQAIARDRNIVAFANTCTHAGTASVKLFSPDRNFTISDRDITDNNCSCR